MLSYHHYQEDFLEMALINCAECNKQISSNADACPNCGHPTGSVRKETVVRPVPVEPEQSFPTWAVVPLVLLGVIAIFGIIYMLQNNDQPDQTNINVNLDSQRDMTAQTQQIPVTQDPPVSDLPPVDTSTVPQTTNDQTIGTDTRTEVVDSSADKGKVELDAKISDPKGEIKPVKAEKFYLLDKELEVILREAKLTPIQNQSLVNSFGLSVLNPGKFKDFNQKALSAINDHIKYDTLTDSNGKASMGDVKPDRYYLFGIHKVGNGFAIWSDPVTITGGINNLNIQPRSMSEFPQ